MCRCNTDGSNSNVGISYDPTMLRDIYALHFPQAFRSPPLSPLSSGIEICTGIIASVQQLSPHFYCNTFFRPDDGPCNAQKSRSGRPLPWCSKMSPRQVRPASPCQSCKTRPTCYIAPSFPPSLNLSAALKNGDGKEGPRDWRLGPLEAFAPFFHLAAISRTFPPPLLIFRPLLSPIPILSGTTCNVIFSNKSSTSRFWIMLTCT